MGYLQFHIPSDKLDHGAAIFVEPWLPPEERKGPLGGEMIGRVRSVRRALFEVLGFAKWNAFTYFKVRIVSSHADGATIGWLPHWQVRVARDEDIVKLVEEALSRGAAQ